MNKLFFPEIILPKLANKEEILIKMLKLFKETSSTYMDEISTAIESFDYRIINKVAHTLKPSLLILFPKEVHDAIRFLEKEAKEDNQNETVKQFHFLQSSIKHFLVESQNYWSH